MPGSSHNSSSKQPTPRKRAKAPRKQRFKQSAPATKASTAKPSTTKTSFSSKRPQGFSTSAASRSSFAKGSRGSHSSMGGGLGSGLGGGSLGSSGTPSATGFNPPASKGFSKGPVVSRRNLLIGAGVVGGLALVGGSGAYAAGVFDSDEPVVQGISVPDSAVTNLDNLTESNAADHLHMSASYKLPAGSLVWADNDTLAACLIPTGAVSPMHRLGLLYFSSGNLPTVMATPQGAAEGYEFMEVRASESGMIWVESNMFEQTWRIYTARVSDAQASAITLVDEGDEAWLIPSIAMCGNRAFWQVVPNAEGAQAKSSSAVKTATIGSDAVDVAWESNRAFATRITGVGDGVIITPRAASTSIYYQLTKLSAEDASMIDQMTLPSAMTPSLASYGKTGFTFCFADIYNYGGGISNLGTYTPLAEHAAFTYDNLDWFRFGRTPSANPSWCGSYFMVKSTRAIAGVSFADNTYFMIEAPSNTDSYGEYLVSSGIRKHVVGLSTITPTGYTPATATDTGLPGASSSNFVSDDGVHTLVRVFAAN